MEQSHRLWEEIEVTLLERAHELLQMETTPKAETLEVVDKLISLALAAATVGVHQRGNQCVSRRGRNGL